MSMHTSVLSIIKDSSKVSAKELKNEILKLSEEVTEGRYLIYVFEIVNDWKSRISIESLVIESTLGSLNDREGNWEYYGNGVVRCYKGSDKKLASTFQWVIVRRRGPKPYKKRYELSDSFLEENEIPVADKVFTRDVANNVWHLLEKNLTSRLIERFSNLLIWHDENFLVRVDGKAVRLPKRQKLDLASDLIGVAHKAEYFWNSEDKLF